MPTIQDLLVIADRFSVELLAPSDPARASTNEITRIVILQSIAALRTVPESSLVIVPAGLLTRQDSSGLDILIRRVSERAGIAVLVHGLVRTQSRLERLATRFDVAVLGCHETVDLGDLVTTLNQTLAGGPADVLVRAWRALDRIAKWEEEGEVEPETLVGQVGEILSESLSLGNEFEHGAPIIVNGHEIAQLGTAKDGELTSEWRIVRPALQYAIAVRMMRADLRERVVREDQSRALAALIVSDAGTVEHYAAMARRIAVDVDGNHCAVAVKTSSDDPLVRDSQAHDAHRALARAVDALPVDMSTTRVEHDLVAVFTGRAGQQIESISIANGVRAAIESVPSLYWGLGTEHVGAAGLRSTVSEARSASNTAAAEGVTTRAFEFDVSGIQRLISEARASVTAGRVAAELLAPLSRLSNPQASIETLNVWLEERGSYKAAAARLHLHPNAVSYRISRIESTLSSNLSDADTRFALQFACRIALSDPS